MEEIYLLFVVVSGFVPLLDDEVGSEILAAFAYLQENFDKIVVSEVINDS